MSQEHQSEEKSFAELFDEQPGEAGRPEPGQKITATVVRIGSEWVFLDVGGKSEGTLAKGELIDKEGNLTVKEGDAVEAYLLSSRHNELIFTTKLGGASAHAHLEEAFHNGIPVEGRVVKEIKGGFEVKVGGTVRAFCPYSQMELRRITNAEGYLDQEFSFKIIEFKEGGRNIILSRRQLLEEERERQKETLRSSLSEGMIVPGTITSVRNFGAFVDIGGIEGLIPISEVAWGKVDDIHAELAAGQKVEVAILKLDWENDRFSFSLKGTQPDPWSGVEERYLEGSTHQGRVMRLATFGAFVALEPGIEGLVHISKLGGGRRINHPREVVEEGQEIEVRVESVDPAKQRISLALAAAAVADEAPAAGKKKGPAAERTADDREALKRYRQQAKPQSSSMSTLGDLLKDKLDKKKK